MKNTIIDYDKESNSWQAVTHFAERNTTARSESSYDSFALGTHDWIIDNDNLDCSLKGDSYQRTLKLSGCYEGDFTCSDGECVNMEHRCDQIVHCRDKSDEKNCSLLVIEDSYNKEIPPIKIDNNKKLTPVEVKVSISFKSVLDISESSHTIDLKLGIKLEWFDNRVLYHNLKRDRALNILSNSEVRR